MQSAVYIDQLSTLLANNDALAMTNELIDPDIYMLGPMDLISITIIADTPRLIRGLTVNTQGDIAVPFIGTINVANSTINDAQELIRQEAIKVYNNPEVKITLEQPRPVTVYITGNVPNPGKRILPAFSRLDEAIFPSIIDTKAKASSTSNSRFNTSDLLKYPQYSYRNINLINEDGGTVKADLIRYFKNGYLKGNPFVKNGDVISVQRLGYDSPKVSISGGVISPSEYEYSPMDSPGILIDMSGGLRPDADTTQLIIFRKINGVTERMRIARSDWETIHIEPNDRLVIPILDSLNPTTSAWVNGEVRLPGNFPITPGVTTAYDLIQFAEGITDQALVNAAYLNRSKPLENQDLSRFNTERFKRTSDQVQQGFEYLDLETKLNRNRVNIDLNDAEQLRSILIFDGDMIMVPRDERTIFVFGQVNAPGFYPYTSDEVGYYINKAGGFALSADKQRTFIIKAGTNSWYKPSETKLESGDKIFIDRTPFDELNAKRSYEIQKQQLRNQRTQLIMTGLTTVTGIITTLVAIGVINR